MPGIEIVIGDITREQVDAVVNAANSTLLGGGGVDGAIHAAGGPAILQTCREIRRSHYPDGLPTGEAVHTPAGNLPARYVIHTVGPVYHREKNPAELLANCHSNSLKIADELRLASVAFPAISTGVYGYPIDEAAGVSLNAVRRTETNVRVVRFVLYNSEAHAAFTAAQKET